MDRIHSETAPAAAQRNPAVDALRGIACVFVILVHVTLPGQVGVYVKALARFAVPFFLINSGWFAWTGRVEDEMKGAKRQLKKILRLTMIVCLLHIVGNSITSLVGGGTLLSWVIPHWKWETLWNFLLFNRSKIFSSVVYYFFMLLYVYPLFLFFLAWRKRCARWNTRIVGILILVLLGANLYISEFNSMTWYYAGNWLLTGVPFFMIGYFMREWVQVHRKVSIRWELSMMIFGFALTLVEIPLSGDDVYLYLGSIITVLPMYHLAVCAPPVIPPALAHFGKKYSSAIFIVHCMVYNLFCAAIGSAAKEEPLSWFMPVAVFAVSLLIAVVFEKIYKKR